MYILCPLLLHLLLLLLLLLLLYLRFIPSSSTSSPWYSSSITSSSSLYSYSYTTQFYSSVFLRFPFRPLRHVASNLSLLSPPVVRCPSASQLFLKILIALGHEHLCITVDMRKISRREDSVMLSTEVLQNHTNDQTACEVQPIKIVADNYFHWLRAGSTIEARKARA